MLKLFWRGSGYLEHQRSDFVPHMRRTSATFSNTLSRWSWMVWLSEAWPRISKRAGSDTKKKRGNWSRFCSKYLEGKRTDAVELHFARTIAWR